MKETTESAITSLCYKLRAYIEKLEKKLDNERALKIGEMFCPFCNNICYTSDCRFWYKSTCVLVESMKEIAMRRN